MRCPMLLQGRDVLESDAEEYPVLHVLLYRIVIWMLRAVLMLTILLMQDPP